MVAAHSPVLPAEQHLPSNQTMPSNIYRQQLQTGRQENPQFQKAVISKQE